jgi:hypothetical protein
MVYVFHVHILAPQYIISDLERLNRRYYTLWGFVQAIRGVYVTPRIAMCFWYSSKGKHHGIPSDVPKRSKDIYIDPAVTQSIHSLHLSTHL